MMVHSYPCDHYSSWYNVDEYLRGLEEGYSAADFDAVVENCNYTICPTMFGSGNGDICGIGLLAGYFIESTLGFLFGCLFCIYVTPFPFLRLKSETMVGKLAAKRKKALISLMTVFFDTCFMFSGSIIIVSLIFGIRKDVNVGTGGLGAIDSEIAASVGLCTFLPLLYPLVLLPVSDIIDTDLIWRVGKVVACGTLYFYVFVTRFIYAFRKEENTNVLNDAQFDKLFEVCFPQGGFSTAERDAMDIFGLCGSIVLYIVIITFVSYILQEGPSTFKSEEEEKNTRIRSLFDGLFTRPPLTKALFYLVMFVMLPLLCAGQIWTVMRLRAQQLAIASHTTGSGGSQVTDWNFGQVIAIFIWLPVLLELSKLLLVMTRVLGKEMPSLPGPPDKTAEAGP